MTTAERDALIEKNVALAFFIARQFFGAVREVPHDDIVSAALLGLTLAAQRYDPASPYKFSTFAWTTIRGTILTEIRRLTHGGRALHTLTNIDDDGVESFEDLTESPERLDAQIDARKQIERLTLRLSQRSKRIILMRFGDELPVATIAQRCGLTTGRVSQIVAEALEAMRQPLNACDSTMRQRVTRAAYEASRRKEKKAA